MPSAPQEALIAQRSNGPATRRVEGAASPAPATRPAHFSLSGAAKPPPLPARATATARLSADAVRPAVPASRLPAQAAIVRGSSPGLAPSLRPGAATASAPPMAAVVTAVPYEQAFRQWSAPSLGFESDATAPAEEPVSFRILASQGWPAAERRSRAAQPQATASLHGNFMKVAALAVLGACLASFVVAANAFASQDEPGARATRSVAAVRSGGAGTQWSSRGVGAAPLNP